MSTCLFCDIPISTNWKTCKLHYHFYVKYKDTEWLKELIRMERKQSTINKRECIPIDNLSTSQEHLSQNYKNTLGARQLDHDLIFQLRREGVPFRLIAVQLGCAMSSVKSVVYRKRLIPIRPYLKKSS